MESIGREREKPAHTIFKEEFLWTFLWSGLLSITWQQVVMYVVGLLLIYLAIEKNYEPALLLPMGFGAILVNLPASGVLNQFMEGAGETHGIIQWLFESGIEASEAFPTAALYRYRSYDRLWTAAFEPEDVPLWCSCPHVRHSFLRSLWHHFSAFDINGRLPLVGIIGVWQMVRLRSWYLRC